VPRVGNKSYPYTAKGKAAAKKASSRFDPVIPRIPPKKGMGPRAKVTATKLPNAEKPKPKASPSLRKKSESGGGMDNVGTPTRPSRLRPQLPLGPRPPRRRGPARPKEDGQPPSKIIRPAKPRKVGQKPYAVFKPYKPKGK
jgi:hypothetical protein